MNLKHQISLLIGKFLSRLLSSYLKHEQINIVGRLKNRPSNVSFGQIGMIRCPECISIGDGTSFEDWVYLTAWDSFSCIVEGNETEQKLQPQLTIGKNCCFGAFNHITCSNQITIGDNCLTGKWITITDNSHGETNKDSLRIPPIKRPIFSKGPVLIGNNVWIGDKATILPGVTIGDGAVIAANTVVNKDVPAYSVAAGNPATILIKTYE